MNKRYKTTPCYGFIPKDKTQFRDYELFNADMWTYEILHKVKLWYGTPKPGEDNIKDKLILGMQCVYVDTVSGNKTTSEQHCGDITKEDVEVKELELKEGDYINKLYLDFDGGITHLKFLTNKGQCLELGEEKEDTKKTVEINTEKDPHMVQTFFGYYNTYGLRALGCKYISKKNFILTNLMGILRLRHVFNTNEEEKKKWQNPEELNKLNYKMRTVAKLCALPDKTFSGVLEFCAI